MLANKHRDYHLHYIIDITRFKLEYGYSIKINHPPFKVTKAPGAGASYIDYI